MSHSVHDKVIFFTGAFGLIGQEVATYFMEQGARVVWADLHPKDETMQVLRQRFNEASYLVLPLDITSPESCQQAVAQATGYFGRIDVLVNCAAIDAKYDADAPMNQSRFENYPLDALRQSVEVNVIGTIIITQEVCKQMLRQGHGNIINVASTYSLVAPNQSLYDFGQGTIHYKPVDYVASKSFIPNFTRYLATFYATENIRCNAIAPHGVLHKHGDAFLENFARLSPMGRMCEREELRGPFEFLASDASSYMTGSLLTVDGGWTAW